MTDAFRCDGCDEFFEAQEPFVGVGLETDAVHGADITLDDVEDAFEIVQRGPHADFCVDCGREAMDALVDLFVDDESGDTEASIDEETSDASTETKAEPEEEAHEPAGGTAKDDEQAEEWDSSIEEEMVALLADGPDDEDALTSKPAVEAWVADRLLDGWRRFTGPEAADATDTSATWAGRAINQLDDSEAPLLVNREHHDNANKTTIYIITPEPPADPAESAEPDEGDEDADGHDGGEEDNGDVQDNVKEHSETDSQDDSEETEADDEPPELDRDDEDLKWWCGYCGEGPWIQKTGVDDHHERAGHPGEPLRRTIEPLTDELECTEGNVGNFATSDPGERVAQWIEGCVPDRTVFCTADVAVECDITGNEAHDALEIIDLDDYEIAREGSVWRVRAPVRAGGEQA